MLKDLFFALKGGNGWIKCSKNVEMWKYGLWKSKLTIHPRARVPIIYIDPDSPIYTSCASPPPKEVFMKKPIKREKRKFYFHFRA